MKQKNNSSQNWQEVVISIILLILMFIVINPGKLWMPTVLQICLNLGLLIVFSLFSLFIWKENAHDEREQLHRLIAGRIAFIAGASVITIGIIIQGIHQSVDPWLPATLGVMVIAKTISLRIEAQRK